MSNNDRMQKIDVSKLKDSEKHFLKFVEAQNLQRVQRLQNLRKKNLITVSALGAAVLGIYGYSIYSVSQESFLDDFNEPATTTN